MPTLTCYHLQPQAAFHSGRRGVGQEETAITLPSDTLFAALVATSFELGQSVSWLDQFEKRDQPPPFQLTSTFPQVGQLRFYPVPALSNWPLKARLMGRQLKPFKKINFVSEGVFDKMIKGEPLDDYLPPPKKDDIQATDVGLTVQGMTLWLLASELDLLPQGLRTITPNKRQTSAEEKTVQLYRALRERKAWQAKPVPRVAVDRVSNASNIFYTGRTTFAPECGLWFGVAWADDGKVRSQIEQVLSVLGDTGLGGRRSIGYGAFDCDLANPPEVEWPAPQPNKLLITLSRYHPHDQSELEALRPEHNQVSYKLVSVGGWLGSAPATAQRRRRLWLLEEGSIIQQLDRQVLGDLTDVRPCYDSEKCKSSPVVHTFPHPVWRYGLACGVRWSASEESS